MSSKKKSKEVKQNKEVKQKVVEEEDLDLDLELDEEEIDLCEDHDYQVLSAIFETESGKNVAEILSKLQKDVHLLATSVSQLIQLSMAAQRENQEESDEDKE